MTDPTEREPASDLPTALAEAGVPSEEGVIKYLFPGTRDLDGDLRAFVAHDLDAIGRVWLARRLEAMSPEHLRLLAEEWSHMNFPQHGILARLAPEAP